MKQYDLSAQSLDMIKRLKKVEWFVRAGEPFEASGVRRAANLRIAKKMCFSTGWDNTLTDSRNQLSAFLAMNHGERYDDTWNEIVDACTPMLIPIIETAAAAGAERLELGASQKKILFMTLRRQLVGACHEIEYGDVMRDLLCLRLIPWYEQGHWPCGYQGNWPEGILVIY